MAKNDHPEPAHRRFRESYPRAVAAGLMLSVGLHVALVELFPQMSGEDYGTSGSEIETVELPPEVEVPPPPEQIARPATPTVPETDISEDITIAPTTFDANPSERLPPPPEVQQEASDRPAFIPRDVDPRLKNTEEIQEALRRFYPSTLKEAGIGGRVLLWIFVDRTGGVTNIQVQESSGYEAFDEAARRVARQMEFSPAINQDRPIGVWVQQRISFQSR